MLWLQDRVYMYLTTTHGKLYAGFLVSNKVLASSADKCVPTPASISSRRMVFTGAGGAGRANVTGQCGMTLPAAPIRLQAGEVRSSVSKDNLRVCISSPSLIGLIPSNLQTLCASKELWLQCIWEVAVQVEMLNE